MNFKLDKVSKEKWISLDMHAETIGVILGADIVKPCILGMMPGEKKKGAPQDTVQCTLITSIIGQGHPWKKT